MTYEITLHSNHIDNKEFAEWVRKQGHAVTVEKIGTALPDSWSGKPYPGTINVEGEDEAWEALAGLWDDYRDQPLRDENGYL
jgi:hypothetical protein